MLARLMRRRSSSPLPGLLHQGPGRRRSGGGAQWRGHDGSAERGLIVAEMAKACLDPDPLYHRAPPRPHLLRVCRQLRRIQGN